MKKMFLAALSALSLAACGPTQNSYSYTARQLVSTSEKTGSDEWRTEYSYDATGSYSLIVRKLNGTTHSETKNFAMVDGKYTRVRINKDVSPETYDRLVTSFVAASYGVNLTAADEVYRIASATTPIAAGDKPTKSTVYTYDSSYLLTEYKETVGETVMLRRRNYDVSHMTDQAPYFTYDESTDDGATWVKMCEVRQVVNNRVLGYEIYRNWVSNTEKGVLKRAKSGFFETDLTDEYTLTEYDDDGKNPVVTTVNNTYKLETIVY